MKTHLLPTLVAFVTLPLAVSCASALKKRCETTNWFEYGEGVAKEGRRTGSDSFVMQCRNEEAEIDASALSQGFQKGLGEYCTPDFAYRLGRQGAFLGGDMCSGGQEIQMKPRHAEGVREYCQPSNGETAGAVGKKYNQICPKEMESAFLPEFRKGRRKYLAALIQRKESEVRDVEQDSLRLEGRKLELRQDLQRMSWEKTRLQGMIPAGADAATDPNVSRLQGEVSGIDRSIQRKQWDVEEADRSLKARMQEGRKLKEELRDAQSELATL